MAKDKVSHKIRKSEQELEKDKRIKKEYKKIKEIYKILPKDTFDLHENLMKNAAFLAVSLEDLQDIIKRDGYSGIYENGKNQSGTKATPEATMYGTYVKNYTSIIKALNELLPKINTIIDESQELLRFATR